MIDSRWRWAADKNVLPPIVFGNLPSAAMYCFYQWNKKVGWSITDPLVNSNGGTTWDTSYPSGMDSCNIPQRLHWQVVLYEYRINCLQ
ncbi:MAG: hypothetical protein LBR67_03570 [Dysgonamonadaceae bacterium]|nr:hypothetical protein [Dysgonamonadaceae bacterium]